MKRILLASLALASFLVTSSQGATIVWGAAADNGLSLANGSNLGIGNLVRVGTFNITDSVIQANAGNIAFLNSHFIEFGNTRIGQGVGGIAEHFQMTSVANGGAGGLNIAGAQLYIWAFASDDNSTVANSIATATQLGIFYFDKAVDAEWGVPLTEPDGFTDIELTELSNGSALANGAHVLVGSFPDGTSDTTGAANFGLAVPEPSAATAVIASVGLLALRRRRRA